MPHAVLQKVKHHWYSYIQKKKVYINRLDIFQNSQNLILRSFLRFLGSSCPVMIFIKNWAASHPANPYSKLTIETLEQGVKYVQS